MGLWYIRKGRFTQAEEFLQKAVKLAQKRNPNPYDGEPVYNLALALKYQGKYDEAYELFWKATWNKAWADAGYFEAACISMADERWEDALDELERSLISNSHNHKARAMKAVVLRKLERKAEALAWIHDNYRIDRFNYVSMFEEHLLTGSDVPLECMVELMHGNIYNYHETALDYAQAGLQDEAVLVLKTAIEHAVEESPLTYYYLAYLSPVPVAMEYRKRAAEACPAGCFPNRLEDAYILQHLMSSPLVDDARAPYYLGCLYYDKRQYDLAIQNWELSARQDPEFPTVWRNLALARFNKQGCTTDALEYMERAFHLDESDARVLMELDQLYKRLQKPHQERLDFLLQYPRLVEQRDDLVLEEITLLNQTGRYREAMQRLDNRKFHPWEGGEGKVTAQYQICRVELAKQLLRANPQSSEAKRLLEECLVYPSHLGEGKLRGAQDNDIYYLLGRFEEGTEGPTEPAAAMYYNDAKPEKIFYAALCYRRLGQENKARSLFNKLVNYGKQHVFDHVVMDYFAVSLPDLLIWDDSLDRKNEIHCKYMLALGYYGLGDNEKALSYLDEVRSLDINHQGIQSIQTFIG
jgi:tetratricopeptide (TPR) repeat protein